MNRRYLSIGLSLLMLFPMFLQAQDKATEVELEQSQLIPKSEEIYAIGTLFPSSEITIRPEISGRIIGIDFIEGRNVAKDDVLIRFDKRVQAANVVEAESKVMIAQQNYERFQAAKAGATAQMRDEAHATLLQAEARLEIAKADLEKMTIHAPFNGTMGLKNFDLGDYIQAGTSLVTLSNTDQLKLEFNIPERVAHIAKVGQQVEFSIDNFPHEMFEAEVYAVSPKIEQEGRSLAIRALYNNTDEKLISGMFTRLALKIPYGYDVVMVPEEAIVAQEGKHFLYIAEPIAGNENQYKALMREVELGERTRSHVEILKGLSGGELVIRAGQIRISDGATVQENERSRTLRLERLETANAL